MTDTRTPGPEGVSAAAAERLAALRQPSKQRGSQARAAKILSAGLSTTALLGMVTIMGWPADPGTAQTPAPSPITAVPPAPTVAAPVPEATLPPPAPTTTLPAPIPVATPVVVPVVQVSAQASNTTTKSSG